MIKPMLAHKFDPDKAVFPALLQPKLDGVRCVFTKDGAFSRTGLQPKLDGVRCVFTKDGAFSRTGKEFKNVDHIKETLKPLFKQYPYIKLDGELYNHKLKDDFEKIISLVRKTKPTFEHRQEAEKLVQYHVYDKIPLFFGDKNNPTYEERLDDLIDVMM